MELCLSCDSKASSPPSPPRSTPTDQVDVDALKANVEALLEAGVHGFVATGTMGEAGRPRREERAHGRRARWSRQPAAACRWSAGVSSGSAGQSLEYARDAKDAGADAIMSLPPLGYRADPDEVVAFFAELATMRPADHGLQQPRGLRRRHAADADRAHLRGGRGRRRHQGVLGRRAPASRRCCNARRRARGARRRRRLGARGLRRRRDRLDHRRRRRRAARVRRALRRTCQAGDLDAARDVYRRMLPSPAST